MDRRFITVLVVSLIFALVVSTVFYKVTSSSGSAPAKVEQTAMKEVVVAAKPLSVGVSIKPGDVRLQKVNGDVLPKDSFTKIDEVLERPIISSILMDEPILEAHLAGRGSGFVLSPITPLWMRADTVRVNDVSVV